LNSALIVKCERPIENYHVVIVCLYRYEFYDATLQRIFNAVEVIPPSHERRAYCVRS